MTKSSSKNRQKIDTLIHSRWLATVNEENQLLERSALAIDDGVIVDLLPSAEASSRYRAREEVNLANHLLIPGLINAHGHSAMSLLRGFADDLPLEAWLQEHIWPAEGQFVSEEFAYDGSLAAMAEMIRTGTTCFADMYFFPEATARAAQAVGMRAHLAPPVFDFPSNWQQTPDAYLAATVELREQLQDDPLITLGIGPHAPYTVSDDSFRKVLAVRERWPAAIHIHCQETAHEVSESLQQYGLRPLARLQQLGVLGPHTQCVHMTQVNDEDIATLIETQASVVHCPKSNLKLASGFCPVQPLLEAGINVALGTDSAASNNSLDMLSEMQYAALLAKAASGNASAVDAHTALRLATINGARALGIADRVGSLEVGKQADITAVKLDGPRQGPVYSPLSALVYTQTGSRVSDVWIAGRRQLARGKLRHIDQDAVNARASHWHDKIANFAAGLS
ncbi:TRZ/ATZ family hydrolase [Halioxenophilus sp. WMMB6]|uniref:TRZ/ATZ family hydrolase n=1 Tax=Halioxenophilus sp. WMMB6 TaxID=3073815 RepID=UPI00295E95AA|nr:TRZ/ATZ family hydrolase [Halioxenophilus sp. WMMB6]